MMFVGFVLIRRVFFVSRSCVCSFGLLVNLCRLVCIMMLWDIEFYWWWLKFLMWWLMVFCLVGFWVVMILFRVCLLLKIFVFWVIMYCLVQLYFMLLIIMGDGYYWLNILLQNRVQWLYFFCMGNFLWIRGLQCIVRCVLRLWVGVWVWGFGVWILFGG